MLLAVVFNFMQTDDDQLRLREHLQYANGAEYKAEGWKIPKPFDKYNRKFRIQSNGYTINVESFFYTSKYLCAKLKIKDNVYAYTIDITGDKFGDYYLVDRNGDGVFRWKIYTFKLLHPLIPPKWVKNIKI
jgi:hypothetical protein